MKSILSEGEIVDLQEKSEKCIRMIKEDDCSWDASAATIMKISNAFTNVRDCYESFGDSLTE